MGRKFINRNLKKLKDRQKQDSDEWSKILGINEEENSNELNSSDFNFSPKLEIADVMDVKDRTITFKNEIGPQTNFEEYVESSEEVKDSFGNTSQYLKFVNAHLKEKEKHFDKLKKTSERFQREIDELQPNNIKNKTELDRLKYNEIKIDDVKRVISHVENQRNAIKLKRDHLAQQTQKYDRELTSKNEQISDLKVELDSWIKESQKSKNKLNRNKNIHTSSYSTSTPKQQANLGELRSTIVNLNAKNQATQDELKTVREDFKKMKEDYERLTKQLAKKNSESD